MHKFDIPEPKKIAPQLTAEQRQAMAPVDLLVQYIMPKLLDKVNYLEWTCKAEFHSIRESIDELQRYADKIGDDSVTRVLRMGERVDEVERGLANISEVNKRMLATVHDGVNCMAQTDKNPKRKCKCKKDDGDKSADTAPVQQLESDPRQTAVEADISEPVAMSVIARYDAQADNWVPKIIGGIEITAKVVNAVMDGDSSYHTDVLTFVYDMTVSERKVLCAQFPD